MATHRAMNLTLAEINFADRAEVRAHLRNIRKRWWNKGPINGRDHALLLEVFRHHPSASHKAPAGVSHFEVRRAPQRGDRSYGWCFYVIDRDGNTSDFSANKALREIYGQGHTMGSHSIQEHLTQGPL